MPNFLIVLAAALVPMVIGFIWYHPKTFGTAWMKAASLTEADLTKGKMGVIFILCYVFSILIGLVLYGIVVHQAAVFSLFMHFPEFPDQMANGSGEYFDQFTALMTQFDGAFRTFGHGAMHGGMASIFFALPVLGINALFERRGGKYIFIHAGYWFVTLMLMGGIICQWG